VQHAQQVLCCQLHIDVSFVPNGVYYFHLHKGRLSSPHPTPTVEKYETGVRMRDRRHYAPFRLARPYTTCDTTAMRWRYDTCYTTRVSHCFSASSGEDDMFVIRWMRTLKMASKLITVLYRKLITDGALPVLTTTSSRRFLSKGKTYGLENKLILSKTGVSLLGRL
jgi:hypothetical protein